MTISLARRQFPPVIIRHAVWLYVRFTLSYRDVEDLLAERGLDASCVSIGPLIAGESQALFWQLQESKDACERGDEDVDPRG
jgi:hypothetical protein